MYLSAKPRINELSAGLHLTKTRDMSYALSNDKTTILKTSKGEPGILITFADRNNLLFQQIFWINAGGLTFNHLFGCLKIDHLPKPVDKQQALGIKVWICIRKEIDSAGVEVLSIFKVFPYHSDDDKPIVHDSEFVFKK